ncbi:MAG: hypothetical protein NTV54_01995 [Ignavibacteriales bacterium]|nr:hypothetical protein [Ignavibacteriales bacterium]
MKRSVAVIAAIVVTSLLMGCTETSDPVSAPSGSSAPTVSILDLPVSSTHSLAKTSDPVLITPAAGGVVSVTSSIGSSSSVTMTLTFEPGTVSAPTWVSISLNGWKAMADFSPSGTVFKKPVLLDADITGLNLSKLPSTTKVGLYYLSGSKFEQMSTASLTWDASSGTLHCEGGSLPHFSIYGFGFTK